MCIEQWTNFPCGHTAIRIQGCLQQQQTNCNPSLCPFYQVTFLNAPMVFKLVSDQQNKESNLRNSTMSGPDGNRIDGGTEAQLETDEKLAKKG
ncbi:hypothetical protein H4I96_09264 [Botrytis cinerea]